MRGLDDVADFVGLQRKRGIFELLHHLAAREGVFAAFVLRARGLRNISWRARRNPSPARPVSGCLPSAFSSRPSCRPARADASPGPGSSAGCGSRAPFPAVQATQCSPDHRRTFCTSASVMLTFSSRSEHDGTVSRSICCLFPLVAGFAAEQLHADALVKFLIGQVAVGFAFAAHVDSKFLFALARSASVALLRINCWMIRFLRPAVRGPAERESDARRTLALHFDDCRVQIISFDFHAFAFGHDGIAEQRIQARRSRLPAELVGRWSGVTLNAAIGATAQSRTT